MVGVHPLGPGDLVGRVIGDVDVLAVIGVLGGGAQREDHGERVARRKRNRGVERHGVVAGVGEVAALAADQGAGGGVLGGGEVLVDLQGVGGGLVPGGDGDGLELLRALGGENVGHLAVVVHCLVVGHVAGAVVLIVVVVVVHSLGGVEEAGVVQRGGVFIRQVEVAAVAPGGAPGVLDDPRAVAGGAVGGLEVGARVVVIPADHGDGVVAVLVAARAVGGTLLEAVGAGAGVVVAVGVVVADAACAIVHDGLLHGVAVGRGDPGHVGDMGVVVGVSILGGQARGGGRAVFERCGVLAGGAGPAHHGERGHCAVAALIEIGVAQRLGGVAGEHPLFVIGRGIVEPGQVQL